MKPFNKLNTILKSAMILSMLCAAIFVSNLSIADDECGKSIDGESGLTKLGDPDNTRTSKVFKNHGIDFLLLEIKPENMQQFFEELNAIKEQNLPQLLDKGIDGLQAIPKTLRDDWVNEPGFYTLGWTNVVVSKAGLPVRGIGPKIQTASIFLIISTRVLDRGAWGDYNERGLRDGQKNTYGLQDPESVASGVEEYFRDKETYAGRIVPEVGIPREDVLGILTPGSVEDLLTSSIDSVRAYTNSNPELILFQNDRLSGIRDRIKEKEK